MGNLSFWIDDNVIYAILATLVICFTVRTIYRSRVDHAWAVRTYSPAESTDQLY